MDLKKSILIKFFLCLFVAKCDLLALNVFFYHVHRKITLAILQLIRHLWQKKPLRSG